MENTKQGEITPGTVATYNTPWSGWLTRPDGTREMVTVTARADRPGSSTVYEGNLANGEHFEWLPAKLITAIDPRVLPPNTDAFVIGGHRQYAETRR